MSISTEMVASQYRGLDTWGTSEMLTALWEGQLHAVAAVQSALPALSAAVESAAQRLRGSQGRLIYVGAGSSGVISLLDSLELGSTFDWPEEQLAAVLASGADLTHGLSDGVEDDGVAAVEQIEALSVGEHDVVVGVSASGGVPFTVQALKKACELGALTIGFTNSGGSALQAFAQHLVLVETGAEVIAGSTRLGAGTSQKVLFNLFSTGVMTQLGAVHDNLMVNVRPANAKLRQRCVDMVAHIAEVSQTEAAEALATQGTVKKAVLALAGVPDEQIEARLNAANGVLRTSLQTKDNQE